MVKEVRGGAGSGGDADKYKNAQDAKHLLDMIGEKVYKEKVKKEAEERSKGELEGKLSLAPILGVESAYTTDPCQLIEDKGEKLAARGDPCGNGSGNGGTGNDDLKRFSKERVSKYDEKKIKHNSEGACAPYRRLSLCNKNFQKINNDDSSKAKHDLLLDVCYAAKYEGESITLNYPKYQTTYDSFPFELCTVLARSFADIGDIVRGKDLYRGNNKEKEKREKLEQKLKEIFKKIHGNLRNGVKDHYNGDGDNYYQLREDWWTANRETVWKAITCNDRLGGNAYFRKTCSDTKGSSVANHKCRCPNGNDQVPTYFDYVPQFLRWFEEWAEDFCRKKKKYVDIVKTYCRGKYQGADRYCSRNGYDCTKTKPAIGKYRMGNQCTKCLFACNPYVEWIDNQRKQFDKQKKKYDEEMQKYTNGGGGGGGRRLRRGATATNYDGYESKFYKELQSNGYGSVDAFLEKLSKEKVCEQITTQEEGRISFENVNSRGGDGVAGSGGASASSDTSGTNNENEGTFYRSKYCQPCPHCGMKKKGGKWEPKQKDENCTRGKLYEPRDEKGGTPIRILKSGEGEKDIAEKLEQFCNQTSGSSGAVNAVGGSDSQKLYEDWKCYKHNEVQKVGQKDEDDDEDDDVNYVKNAGGLCILKNKNKKEKPEPNSQNNHADIQKTFNDFFNFWVAHMLKDSIYWRTKKIKGCLEKKNGNRCKNSNKCNRECGCFQRWVGQKREEWGKIKEQFRKQDDIGQETKMDPIVTLELVLQIEFLNEDSAEDTQNSLDAEEIKHLKEIKKILDEEKKREKEAAGGSGTGSATGKRTIMDKLIDYEKGEADNCLETHKDDQCLQDTGGSRALTPLTPVKKVEDAENEDEEEEEEEEEDDQEEQPEDTTEDTETPKVDGVKPACDIVATLFENPEYFKEVACNQKYGYPQRHWGWKCISETTTGKSDGSSGAMCIPPRRRRLYVGGLTNWATNTQASVSPGDAASTSTTESSLLQAFVKSAAVETFFLWDRYKKEWMAQKLAEKARDAELPFTFATASSGHMKALPVAHGVQSPQVPPTSLGLSGMAPGGPGAIPGAQLQNGVPGLGIGVAAGMGVAPGVGALGGEQSQVPHLPLRPQLGGLSGMQDQPIAIQAPVTDSESPQSKLQQTGEIPNDFLRLMFYTLGDYRDICIGDEKVINTLKAGGIDITTINDKIKEHINSGDTTPPRVTQTQPSDKRTNWWNNNAKYIWEGMICALTYKENEGKTNDTQKIKKDDTVYNKFFGENNNKNPGTTGTQKGTYEKDYKYDQVRLKDNDSDTDRKYTEDPINNPKLKDFVEIPTFFRWLHEWGNEFCVKRAQMLKDVRDNCRNSENPGKRHCSGDGHDCTENGQLRHKNMSADPDCPDCYEQCRKYRKWIDIKFEEYHKQENKYDGERQKVIACSKNGGGDNNCCNEIEKHTTAASFLKELKHCKDGQNSEDDTDKSEEDKKNNKIDFTKPLETFSRSTYCKTCPPNKVNCNGTGRGKSGKDPCTPDNGNNWKSVFNSINGKVEKSTIDVDMIDRRGAFIKEYMEKKSDKSFKDLFKTSRLFKGIREQKWECRYKDENTDICELKNFNNDIDLNQYTTFKVLLIYWLEDFLYGYYLLKKKKLIEKCTPKEGETCSEGNSKNDCACVKKWVAKKESEWKEIKNHFNNRKHQNGGDNDMKSLVRHFMETLIPRMDLVNNKGKINDLSTFLKSYGCNCADNSQNSTQNDVVLCLLENLKTKATSCQTQHQPSGIPETECQEPPPLPDEEDLLLEEEEEYTVGKEKVGNKAPAFCEIEEPKEEGEEKCEAAPTPKEPTATESEQKPEEKAPAPEVETKKDKDKVEKAPPKQRPQPPIKLLGDPLVIPSLATSTLMWTVGIGFATFTYFYLK
ncbi:hypothetical protein PFFVO_00738, partial [Plasmodium falciparum Vietnam Oak-Knoll (FVO)]